MRTITIEEHFLAKALAESHQKNELRGGAKQGGFLDSALSDRLMDLGKLRLREMDASGIDMQVISHTVQSATAKLGKIEGGEEIRLVRSANDELAEAVRAHPDRFAGFAFLPMRSPQAAAVELERAIKELGFKGAVINGTTDGRFLDDPQFLPILERAAALDVPIYLHPAPPPEVVKKAYYSGFLPQIDDVLSTAAWGWHSELGIHALRMILAGVFDRLPTLQIIIGHMGEMIPFMLARIDDTLGHVVENLRHPVPEYFLQNFYITTSGFFTEPPLMLALQVMGVDRIIFAVDYPYASNEQGRVFLDRAPISVADKEKISHLNAERVLKL